MQQQLYDNAGAARLRCKIGRYRFRRARSVSLGRLNLRRQAHPTAMEQQVCEVRLPRRHQAGVHKLRLARSTLSSEAEEGWRVLEKDKEQAWELCPSRRYRML